MAFGSEMTPGAGVGYPGHDVEEAAPERSPGLHVPLRLASSGHGGQPLGDAAREKDGNGRPHD